MLEWVFKAGKVASLAAVIAIAGSASASAHQAPGTCTSSGATVSFDVTASELNIIHRNGDRLDLTVRVRNDVNPDVCDITDATITVQTPNPDGTPGPTTTVASGVNLLAGTPQVALPTTVPYDVDFDAATFQGPVTVAISGTSHFGEPDTTGSIGSLSTPVVISKPQATVNVAPVLPSGPVPFAANYTYSLTNDSPENTAPGQPEPELGNGEAETSVLSDDTCTNLTFTGGNTDNEFPPHVDRGETWTFTCSHMFGAPGTFTNHVSVVGTSSRDGRPWPAATDESTVTATGPDMTVTKSHVGNFAVGDTGRTYTLTARNSGNSPTTAAVTLQDTLPAGLTATAISGTGWSCNLAGLSCTRADALAGGAAYPAVTVRVSVAANAPARVTNVASVSGGGETPTANNTASDQTRIAQPPASGGGGGGDDGGGDDGGGGDGGDDGGGGDGGDDGGGGDVGGGGDGDGEEPAEDRDPPEGEIRKVKVKGDDVKVRFASDEAGSSFECRLDKKKLKPCTSPKRYRNLKDGKHKVLVAATDAAGNEDAKAAKAKFKVG